ncbi:MAG: nucleotidyltransferase family protein [Acidimicrobiales bacterium]
MRDRTAADVAHQLWMDTWAAEVVAAMEAGGLRPILLKGASTAGWLYPEAPHDRPYADLDLIVAPDQQAPAEAVLTTLGFAPEARWWPRDDPPHARAWIRSSDGASVDLHHSLHDCDAVADAEVWAVVSEAPQPWPVGARNVEVPSEEVRALHLVLHFNPRVDLPDGQPARDLERGVRRLTPGTWEGAAAAARRLGVEDLMSYRLHLVDGGSELAALLQLPDPASPEARLDSPEAQFLLRLQALPGVRSKTRFLLEKAFPPRNYMTHPVRFSGEGSTAMATAYLRRVGAALADLPRLARTWSQIHRRRNR